MELNKRDRLILYHQYRILEALYPDEAVDFARQREAVKNGYELHYDWMTEFLVEPVSKETCLEVLSILSMHSALLRSAKELSLGDDILNQVKFFGFDGNNETELMSYTQFLILELGRFSDLKEASPRFATFNSHMPTMHRYKPMLDAWNALGKDKWKPSQQQVMAILEAGRNRA